MCYVHDVDVKDYREALLEKRGLYGTFFLFVSRQYLNDPFQSSRLHVVLFHLQLAEARHTYYFLGLGPVVQN